MSHYSRRTLAALGLMAALLLAAPAPSRAAGLWEIPAAAPGIAVRVRAWLEGLLPGSHGGSAARTAKQGSAIDPNGRPIRSTSSGATTDQGSAIDPNGVW